MQRYTHEFQKASGSREMIESDDGEWVRHESARSAALETIPTTWLDSLLTGAGAVVESPPYGCRDIERILSAVKQRLEKAFDESSPGSAT